MIPEQHALLDTLERQDLPLDRKVGMLGVLGNAIGYMDHETYHRYLRVSEAVQG